jgi:succinate dehydrogenase / fumarate reductase, membrane anchor subunit
MATETEPRPPQPPQSPGMLGYRSGRSRPAGGGAEVWWWFFMRISGVVLLFLAIGHVLIMHVPDGGVSRVNFGFVAARWAGENGAFWRTWDWLLLSLALIHGINGLRVVTLDYVRRAGVRTFLNFVYIITGIILFLLGTMIVVTFNPAEWY